MKQYIPKSTLVAEIESIREELQDKVETSDFIAGEVFIMNYFLSFLDTLEVKEVDLDDYYHKFLEKEWFGNNHVRTVSEMMAFTAKHFFDLGLKASNPITEVNLESLVRQVIGLYLEAGEHYNSVIKEERKEYGGSDLAIKLFDGVIDAKELSIQYVLDKLKAQKG